MDNFYQRLGVRALNDSIPESSKTKEKYKRNFVVFVSNQSSSGEISSEASLYTENELYGVNENDIGFELFGFAGKSSDDEKLYTLTIAGIWNDAAKELLFL